MNKKKQKKQKHEQKLDYEKHNIVWEAGKIMQNDNVLNVSFVILKSPRGRQDFLQGFWQNYNCIK